MTSNSVAATLPYSSSLLAGDPKVISISKELTSAQITNQEFNANSSLYHSMKNCRMAALSWFQFGFNVIPIIPGTKKPAVAWDSWLKNISIEKITCHWSQHPGHELGFIVGDDHIVFDTDSPESIAALAMIENSFGINPNLVVITKKGEHHYFRRAQSTYAKSDSHCTEAHPERIDVKTGRALIVIPPSTGKSLQITGQLPVAKSAIEITEISQDFIDAVFTHNGRPAPSHALASFEIGSARKSLHSNMRVLSATVFHFDADCGRADWIRIGMVICNETGKSDGGFELFNEWSSTAHKKYGGITETEKTWHSFQQDPSNPVKIGTLFRLLSQFGISREMIYAEAEPFQKIGGKNDAI